MQRGGKRLRINTRGAEEDESSQECGQCVRRLAHAEDWQKICVLGSALSLTRDSDEGVATRRHMGDGSSGWNDGVGDVQYWPPAVANLTLVETLV